MSYEDDSLPEQMQMKKSHPDDASRQESKTTQSLQQLH